MMRSLSAFRRHPVTWTLVGICLLVYVAEVAISGNTGLVVGQGPVGVVIAMGAVIPQLVLQGEVWRLVTAGFIHFDLTHILFNMVGLIYGGRWCEERFGSARTLAIFMVAVVAGDVAALVTTLDSRTITAGASGGIMGLFAAMGVVGYRYPLERESLARAAGPVVATLLNGLIHTGVSNAGHVGGLLGGAATAAVLGASPRWAATTREAHAAALEAFAAHVDEVPAQGVPNVVAADPANTLSLERSRRKTLPVWGALAFFAIVAGVGAASGQWVVAAIGLALVCLGVFGLVNHVTLVLTPLGFEVRQRLRPGRGPVAWRDVETIGYMVSPRGGAGESMSYTLKPAALHRLALETGRAQSPTPRLVGAVYGMSAEDQARLMEEWRRRWV